MNNGHETAATSTATAPTADAFETIKTPLTDLEGYLIHPALDEGNRTVIKQSLAAGNRWIKDALAHWNSVHGKVDLETGKQLTYWNGRYTKAGARSHSRYYTAGDSL